MTKLDISGMTCGHCQQAVTSALESVAGTQKAHVDLSDGTAEVEGTASPEALIAAVEDEGYQATLKTG